MITGNRGRVVNSFNKILQGGWEFRSVRYALMFCALAVALG